MNTCISRNLSFNSKVWELTLQGDFNFFRFMPGEPEYSFTPYITFGAGIFSYDPYAYLRGEKVSLTSIGYRRPGKHAYIPTENNTAQWLSAFLLAAGIKYSFNERINIGFEVLHRFTNTDYLDDVSKTYVDPAVFPPNPDGSPSNGSLLHDRSYELGEPIGIPGPPAGK